MRHRLLFVVLAAAALWGCGGGGDSPTGPSGPDTAAEYVSRGWDRFEDDDLDGARSDFDAALAETPGYGPALAGRGWTRLVAAAADAAMQAALADFETAVGAGQNGADVHAGRACAALGAGEWSTAAAAALTAVGLEPAYVFAHRRSLTHADLRLVAAAAAAAQGDPAAALTALDGIAGSGIRADAPTTWSVDGVAYDTFAAAVLARLQELSDAHAG